MFDDLFQVGFNMTPSEETPLQEILKLELDKYLDVLQEISSQASKEFALEKVRKKPSQSVITRIFLLFGDITIVNGF